MVREERVQQIEEEERTFTKEKLEEEEGGWLIELLYIYNLHEAKPTLLERSYFRYD